MTRSRIVPIMHCNEVDFGTRRQFLFDCYNKESDSRKFGEIVSWSPAIVSDR